MILDEPQQKPSRLSPGICKTLRSGRTGRDGNRPATDQIRCSHVEGRHVGRPSVGRIRRKAKMRVHLDDSAKMRHRYRTNLNRYRRLMGVTDKFDVTIEKREFDHNLISHAARCLAAALASSLCECKMLCTVRTYSAQTGNWQARKQTQPVPDPVPAGTGSSWTVSFANNTVLHAEPVRATVCGWYSTIFNFDHNLAALQHIGSAS